MIGCFFALFGLIVPRFILFILWLIGWGGRVFETKLWPILGFLLLPYTTLAYLLCSIYNCNEITWAITCVIAVLLDLKVSHTVVEHS